MWTHVTDDAAAARRMVTEVLASALATDAEDLGPRVCVGPVAQCVDLLGRYAEAGCSRVYLWPVTDEVGQLARVAEEVLPQLPGPG
jgi:alkanesulfonate monooxygenase SsuD/methylene tetrahydromethanopterin reductase-like flavin-dependent oxidoreductase (luciferase family)